jgi:HAD superfamily hydrolase (TIGR01484 family)
MKYIVLAADYDGTLATHGRVDDKTRDALMRLKRSGRKLVLVTGRELDELLQICPFIDIFDRVVAENGALLYRPATREAKVLAERPPDAFIQALREKGVAPLSVGRAVVATWEPHTSTVRGVIAELGLDLQVVLNKRAIMILPTGVDKASGLRTALAELELSTEQTAAVGDAENDVAFMQLCGISAAVANALPIVRACANFVTTGSHGAGVVEFINSFLVDDPS